MSFKKKLIRHLLIIATGEIDEALEGYGSTPAVHITSVAIAEAIFGSLYFLLMAVNRLTSDAISGTVRLMARIMKSKLKKA